MGAEVSGVVEALAHTRKYRHLCPETVARVAEAACASSRSPAEALKRAKRKLHQVFGAYLGGWDPSAAEALVARVPAGGEMGLAKPACLAIMKQHSSTRERLGMLDGLYDELFAATGRPRRVLDLGCGLHPFALPWMGLPVGAEYAACDMDERIVALVNAFFVRMGLAPSARWQDILTAPLDAAPEAAADVVFLLKMLPCLEQQGKGCAARLLGEIRAPCIVTSFPVKSIGGREKGMRAHYRRTMLRLLAGLPREAVEVNGERELFFVLRAG